VVRKVLVHFAGPRQSGGALELAARLARPAHARVTLLAVAAELTATSPEVCAEQARLRSELEAAAAEAARALAEEVEVRVVVARGPALRAVLGEVRRGEHELVVVEAGRLAQRLIREAPVPVTVVPAERAAQEPCPEAVVAAGHSGPTFQSLAAFYTADSRRRRSGERDFGLDWRDQPDGPAWRAAWVRDTGEVYVMRGGTMSAGGGRVELLAAGVGEERLDALLDGWPQVCGRPGSLAWLEHRLAAEPTPQAPPSKPERSPVPDPPRRVPLRRRNAF
jgi:nucleotide-binding universal stress UspA family protein